MWLRLIPGNTQATTIIVPRGTAPTAYNSTCGTRSQQDSRRAGVLWRGAGGSHEAFQGPPCKFRRAHVWPLEGSPSHSTPFLPREWGSAQLITEWDLAAKEPLSPDPVLPWPQVRSLVPRSSSPCSAFAFSLLFQDLENHLLWKPPQVWFLPDTEPP